MVNYYIISDDSYFSYGLAEALKSLKKTVSHFNPADVIRGELSESAEGSVILIDVDCCWLFRNVAWKLRDCKGMIIPIFDLTHSTFHKSWEFGYLSKRERMDNIVSGLFRFSIPGGYRSFTANQESVICAQIDGKDNHSVASSLDTSLASVYRLRIEAMKHCGLWPINSQGVRYLYQILCRNNFQKQKKALMNN
ncbi:hypothetical protein [Klebsiella huaxiensis]|uniref:Uncharacterized protein n=1 Tax=Klebsiella huaxiensis TaxID=2153354 RepID=A0A564PXM4_9ENTR|nr:hypothetical protein [Klebsiella huaxiensis]MDG1640978.1 hypothetical protein [Klebsiella huaxiensis]VUT03117.1 hypothetical protein SB6422_03616 [Klebsiella huaxiensis]VUT23386.1 hypothetical protein SB6421_02755 [Klebsiella huaxiensis]